jgi:hypothetical protein
MSSSIDVMTSRTADLDDHLLDIWEYADRKGMRQIQVLRRSCLIPTIESLGTMGDDVYLLQEVLLDLEQLACPLERLLSLKAEGVLREW